VKYMPLVSTVRCKQKSQRPFLLFRYAICIRKYVLDDCGLISDNNSNFAIATTSGLAPELTQLLFKYIATVLS
jgi:hypothetical protein